MNDIKQYNLIVFISKIMAFIILFFYGDTTIFTFASIFIFLIMIFRAVKINSKKRFRFYLIMIYILILVFQFTFFINTMNVSKAITPVNLFNKTIGIFLLILPYIVERLITINKYTEFYFPSVQEFNTFSFNELKRSLNIVHSSLENIDKLKNAISTEKIEEIIKDLPRHSSIRYINNGSLSKNYFKTAYNNLNDPYIYIVISNTGSAASELISVFTKKQYNHASLSFDSNLRTIISYNGGEKIYPPGLNHEMIEYFNKKEDASIKVYKLKASTDQKKKLIDKVKEINEEGSAYNILGLVLKSSHKPNIMFCSQFVYKMLKYADLAYFNKKVEKVKPTDLIELDYYRKLEFCYEIIFNQPVKYDEKIKNTIN